MRAVVVMVAAGWFATATAWAAAPTAAHAAKAQHSAHKSAHQAAKKSAHKKGAKSAKSSKPAAKGHASAHVHSPHNAPHNTRQTSVHKPAKPAAVRPTQRHKLMVDAPAVPSTPAVSAKRATPQQHELPPILS